MLSKLTESEKAALILRAKQARQQYSKSVKSKCGGYSSPKMQRLNEIKKLQKEGKATENDLKFLQDYREKTKLTRRKERAALKGVVPKGQVASTITNSERQMLDKSIILAHRIIYYIHAQPPRSRIFLSLPTAVPNRSGDLF